MALSKTRQSPSMVPTVLERAIRPLSTVSVRRGREGRNQRQKQKQKGSHWLPFFVGWGQIPLRSKGV